ncbi:ribosomal-processing cysteine protease Prp [Mesoaciditoga lauensis]|uniref:ribosomal-processing cysteine protease Prp n=1 Tax=Mesoaciditoga lauensis TaxID=1495039 RepID=UPI00069102C3|nr:ribosomal-processing cysteine protease Prp [Mesoaciditoga lauensis]
MTRCEFLFHKGLYVGFRFYGHVGIDRKGKDVVCAAVSAVTQATIIGLEEVLGEEVEYEVKDGSIRCTIHGEMECAQRMVETLHKTVSQLSIQYPKNLSVSEMEVQ